MLPILSVEMMFIPGRGLSSSESSREIEPADVHVGQTKTEEGRFTVRNGQGRRAGPRPGEEVQGKGCLLQNSFLLEGPLSVSSQAFN